MSTRTNTGLHFAVICAAVVALPGASIAVAQTPLQDGPAKTYRSLPGDAVAAATLGPVTIMQLGAIDFQPVGSATYEYAGSGGVQVTAGSQFFNAGLPLPAGTRLLTVSVYINPNGASRFITVTRYRPSNPPVLEQVASANSTNGTAVEAVLLNLQTDMLPGWNYRIDNTNLSAGGAILYGAKIRYRPPMP